ncbi:flagellar protein FlaG [Cohnella sp. REN36]|uniref:flagellar protein FlaG n=1 Tax=Cohnella sp. REN36 TaxID=2887347 RepID=UPI001D13E7C6|nr:flagellar protein FlaG [Cohnella sp. REN36]MCC3374071.1 flagellar protein FlaG [Cohnella sp. REN36]
MDVKAISASMKAPMVETVHLGGSSQAVPPIEAYPSASELLHKEKYELSVSDQAVRIALERANKTLEGIDRRFEYSVHEKTGDVIIKVINKDTNELVREIPNEKFLDLVAKLQELVGMNIDEKR